MANIQNLLMGAGTLYVAEFGTDEPDDAYIDTAPDDADWRDVGFTNGGVTINIEREFAEFEVDQIIDHPGRQITSRNLTVTTQLAEPTLLNLSLITNNSVPVDGAGIETYQFDDYVPTIGSTYRALIFDGYAPGGSTSPLRRRIIVRRVLSMDSVAMPYTKGGQTQFSVTWSAHYVSSVIKPFKIVDETVS